MVEATGEQLKMEGLEAATKKHAIDLAKAQALAELWGMGGRVVTSDDIYELFLAHEGRELKIGNCAGALFRTGKWEYVGRKKSVRPSAHARYISCWKLTEKANEKE